MAEFLFDWREHGDSREERFRSNEFVGSEYWRDYTDVVETGRTLLNRLISLRVTPELAAAVPPRMDVLFISHQRADTTHARRSTWIPYEYGRARVGTHLSVNVSARIYDYVTVPECMQQATPTGKE